MGAVDSINVIRTTPPFTAAVVEAVEQWSFTPAVADGRAVATSVMVLGVFSAPPSAAEPAPRSIGRASPGVPTPHNVVAPRRPKGRREGGLVVLEIHVDSNGNVTRAEVVSSHPGLDAAAARVTGRWVLQPAAWQQRTVDSVAYAIVGFADALRSQ
jgi:TonB family protein